MHPKDLATRYEVKVFDAPAAAEAAGFTLGQRMAPRNVWNRDSAAAAVLYARTWVHYRVFRYRLRMPLLLGFVLVSLFIWFAENIGTWSSAWIYPSQEDGWHLVGLEKLGAWFLLMIISFVLVTLVHRPQPLGAVDSDRAPTNVRPALSPD